MKKLSELTSLPEDLVWAVLLPGLYQTRWAGSTP